MQELYEERDGYRVCDWWGNKQKAVIDLYWWRESRGMKIGSFFVYLNKISLF